MIKMSKELFDFLVSKPLDEEYYKLDTPENKHQSKVIKLLENEGFEVIKIIAANKSGNADIIACSPVGQFWKIEVKRECKDLRKLQRFKLKNFAKKNAVSVAAYGYSDFLYKYQYLSNL